MNAACSRRMSQRREATDSNALAYVVHLLIDDERRHHRLFQDLAASLKHEAEFHSGEPAIPRVDFTLINGSAVRDQTDELIDRERADLKELKKLQKDIRDLKDTDALVVARRVDQRDTDKHIAMLRSSRRTPSVPIHGRSREPIHESDCVVMATNPAVDTHLEAAEDLLTHLLEHVEGGDRTNDLQLVALTAQALATVLSCTL